jgi:hypothetical protein
VDKRIIWIVSILMYILSANAQKFLSDERVIFYSDLVAPAAIEAVDLDGDGDIDIIAALEDEIFWYENVGGEGLFGPHQQFAKLSENLKCLLAADLNGNGYNDVVAAYGNWIVFFQNGGSGEGFGTEQVLFQLPNAVQFLHAADLNGDGHVDLVTATRDSNEVAWFENKDGARAFTKHSVITTDADFVQQIYTADLDGDGDLDVLTASAFDDKIAWYENTDGEGTFGPQQMITTLADYARSVYAADLNGNGFLDVLSASSADDKIAWYENLDGAGTFGAQQVIATTADYPQYVYANDLDGDGQIDVFSASFFDDKVAWYRNLGGGTFSAEHVISELADQAGYVFAGDLDGDGDLDVITASCDFKIAWHENTLPLQILINPGSRFVAEGSDVVLRVSANEYATSFQWQVNSGGGYSDLTATDLYSGIDTDSLEISGFAPEMSGYMYRCVTTDGTNTLISDGAILQKAPEDQVLDADKNCQAILPEFTAGLDFSQVPFPYDKISGTKQVSLISNDAANPQHVTFTIYVQDVTAPVFISSLKDQTIEVNAEGEAFLPNYLNYGVDVSDNCSNSQELTISQSPAYTMITDTLTIVTVMATDLAGNSSEMTFQVRIEDNIAPTITCPEDQYLIVEADLDNYLVDNIELDPLNIFDNYMIVSVINDFNDTSSLEGTEFPLGITSVTWTIMDAGGNVAHCSFNVTVSEETGLDRLEQSGISIYPNPSEGKFHYETSKESILYMRVIDINGKVIIEGRNLDDRGSIDLSGFCEGVYVCNIKTAKNDYMVKMVKE